MIGSGSNTYISVPTLDCIRLVGFSMPQWKNNLRPDVSSSVDFDKKLRTRQSTELTKLSC